MTHGQRVVKSVKACVLEHGVLQEQRTHLEAKPREDLAGRRKAFGSQRALNSEHKMAWSGVTYGSVFPKGTGLPSHSTDTHTCTCAWTDFFFFILKLQSMVTKTQRKHQLVRP